MESLDTIFELCKEAGVHEQAVIPVEKIKFSDEVRHLCEVNYCGSYGKTWACPPGVGSVEECREKCMAFTQVYIFTTWHPLEDSLDLDGMQEGPAPFPRKSGFHNNHWSAAPWKGRGSPCQWSPGQWLPAACTHSFQPV